MSCYHNDILFASSIDGYIKHFEEHHYIDYEKLKKFFDFNQKLDQSRQINLIDYLPGLALYQKTIYNRII